MPDEGRDTFNKTFMGTLGVGTGCCALPFILIALLVIGFLVLGGLALIFGGNH